MPATTLGHVGWHELYTSDWKAAFDFYSSQFGWESAGEFDMGEMGTYKTFSAGAESGGGIMNKPPQIPIPVWQFYFNVDAIDAAATRVTDNGGKIIMGPMDVPSGQWIIQCRTRKARISPCWRRCGSISYRLAGAGSFRRQHRHLQGQASSRR
ncbi:VOC family protein [Mesorhizobium atlanticum]